MAGSKLIEGFVCYFPVFFFQSLDNCFSLVISLSRLLIFFPFFRSITSLIPLLLIFALLISFCFVTWSLLIVLFISTVLGPKPFVSQFLLYYLQILIQFGDGKFMYPFTTCNVTSLICVNLTRIFLQQSITLYSSIAKSSKKCKYHH